MGFCWGFGLRKPKEKPTKDPPCLNLNSGTAIIRSCDNGQFLHSFSASFSVGIFFWIGRYVYLECTCKNLEWSAQNCGRNRWEGQTETGVNDSKYLARIATSFVFLLLRFSAGDEQVSVRYGASSGKPSSENNVYLRTNLSNNPHICLILQIVSIGSIVSGKFMDG